MSLFNFGQVTPAQPVQQQSSGFSFNLGQPATSQASFETPFGQTVNAFHQPTQTVNAFHQPASSGSVLNQSLSLTSAQPVAAASTQPVAVSAGLGGEGATNQAATSDSKLPKDSQTLPAEILSIVDSLKTFIADQKSLCDKNCLPKYSVQPILDICSELDESFKTALQRLDVTLERNKTAVELLKKETNVMVSDGENAFRSIKSLGISANSSYPFVQSSSYVQNPSSYPFVQNPGSPARTSVYFHRLVNQFEQEMDMYSKQIKELEVHLVNMNKPHSPHEVILIVKKQHETLVALASEIYALHQHISSLDNTHSNPPPRSESFTKKSFLGPNPFALTSNSFALTSSSNPFSLTSSSNPPVSIPHYHSGNPVSNSSSFLPVNPSTNFSLTTPSNTSSSNPAKRFTAS